MLYSYQQAIMYLVVVLLARCSPWKGERQPRPSPTSIEQANDVLSGNCVGVPVVMLAPRCWLVCPTSAVCSPLTKQ